MKGIYKEEKGEKFRMTLTKGQLNYQDLEHAKVKSQGTMIRNGNGWKGRKEEDGERRVEKEKREKGKREKVNCIKNKKKIKEIKKTVRTKTPDKNCSRKKYKSKVE